MMGMILSGPLGGGVGPPSNADSSRRDQCPQGSSRRGRVIDSSDKERATYRQAEAEEIELTTLPTTAVEHESWWPHVVDLVTAGARDPDDAVAGLMRVTRKTVNFEDLRRQPPN